MKGQIGCSITCSPSSRRPTEPLQIDPARWFERRGPMARSPRREALRKRCGGPVTPHHSEPAQAAAIRRYSGDCPFESRGAKINVPPAGIEYVKVLFSEPFSFNGGRTAVRIKEIDTACDCSCPRID